MCIYQLSHASRWIFRLTLNLLLHNHSIKSFSNRFEISIAGWIMASLSLSQIGFKNKTTDLSLSRLAGKMVSGPARIGLRVVASVSAKAEPDLSVRVNGLDMPNPFVIGSGPPGTNYTVMKRAFDEGWGAVIAKTVSILFDLIIFSFSVFLIRLILQLSSWLSEGRNISWLIWMALLCIICLLINLELVCWIWFLPTYPN